MKEAELAETTSKLSNRLKLREDEGYAISKDYFAYKREVKRSKEALADERELLKVEKKFLEE